MGDKRHIFTKLQYINREVIVVRYEQFYPEDKVITIVEYDGVPSGTIGRIESRWMGTSYVVRLPDGSFRWLSDRSFAPADQTAKKIEVGDVGVVTSDSRQNFAKQGDMLKVFKIAYDVDYYGINFGGEFHWLGGFQLAPYT